MKVFKRNAVIVTVLLFVCVAVYLNWSYNRNGEDENVSANNENVSNKEATAQDSNENGLYYETDAIKEKDDTVAQVSEYFAQVRLNRQQARDEASETLSLVSETEGASQETIDEALAQITQIAQWTAKEAEIESLIMAKGFPECVAYISDNGITITVQSSENGLSSAAVARITDVVTTETDFTAEQLTIVEIK